MNNDHELSATDLLKQECRDLKITQKDLANAFCVNELTVNRMLNHESNKLEDAFQMISTVTRLTGKMAFQYTNTNLEDNQRLKLIDQITQMSEEEVESLCLFRDLLHQNKNLGNTMYSSKLQYTAMMMIMQSYPKILKVNLTTDSHLVIHCQGKEWELTNSDLAGYDSPQKFSAWLKKVGNSSMIHPDDQSRFLHSTNLFSLRKYLRTSNEVFRLAYRRKAKDSYRWVSFRLIKAMEYTNRNQVAFLYLVDAHDFITEMLSTQHDLDESFF